METNHPVKPEELSQQHPADIADTLQRLPVEEGLTLLQAMPAEPAGHALVELEYDYRAEVVASLAPQELVRLVQPLEHHETADLIAELEGRSREQIIQRLPDDVALPVRTLLDYPEDSAGGIMSDRFVTLSMDESVERSQERLRNSETFLSDDISYLYVVDAKKALKGIVSFRDLVFAAPGSKVSAIMRQQVTCLRLWDDQEEISRQFAHYHYLGLPVLDDQDRVVGVVRSSDVLEIAREEATEDMQLMVGLSGEERVLTSWKKSLPRRLPWLLVNLATAFAAAAVVGMYEGVIAQWTALAVFLPIIAGQGGNAGMQTLTVIIRDMALGEISPGDGRRALVKELILGIANGLAIGLLVGAVSYLWKGSALLGWIVFAAMVLNQLAAGLAGVLIPFTLKRLRVDPALASSIFLTTITDVAGFFFFLSLAALAMRWALPQ
ncbi:MAG: magnesium transporter [Limisphaerales bacterium]